LRGSRDAHRHVLSSRLVRGTRPGNAVNRRADAEDPIYVSYRAKYVKLFSKFFVKRLE
jgi:hypothetical protein